MNTITKEEARLTMDLAIGRLFRMGSRPSRPGDVATYYAVRSAIMDAAETLGVSQESHEPNYVRDRLKGASGD